MTQPTEPAPVMEVPWRDLANCAWVAAWGLQRYRQARANRDDNGAHQYARHVHAARDALSRATGQAPRNDLPRPLDRSMFEQASEIARRAEQRWARVVSTRSFDPDAPEGQWATVGEVPEIGPVGWRTYDRREAEAVRQMILTADTRHLDVFAVTSEPINLDRRDLRAAEAYRGEYPTLVASMNRADVRDRSIARYLRGSAGAESELETAIGRHFDDLDQPTEAEALQDRLYAQPTTEQPSVAVGAEPSTETAASAQQAAEPVAVRATLPGPAGREYPLFDPRAAMQLYPAPDRRFGGLQAAEYRADNGALLPGDEAFRDLVHAIPSWNPGDAEHRRFAAELYGQNDEVDAALRNQFPGLDLAMRAHAAAQRAAVEQGNEQTAGRRATEREQDAAVNRSSAQQLPIGNRFDPNNWEHQQEAERLLDEAGLAGRQRAIAKAALFPDGRDPQAADDQAGVDEQAAQVERAREAESSGSKRQAQTELAAQSVVPNGSARTKHTLRMTGDLSGDLNGSPATTAPRRPTAPTQPAPGPAQRTAPRR